MISHSKHHRRQRRSLQNRCNDSKRVNDIGPIALPRAARAAAWLFAAWMRATKPPLSAPHAPCFAAVNQHATCTRRFLRVMLHHARAVQHCRRRGWPAHEADHFCFLATIAHYSITLNATYAIALQFMRATHLIELLALTAAHHAEQTLGGARAPSAQHIDGKHLAAQDLAFGAKTIHASCCAARSSAPQKTAPNLRCEAC